MTLLAIYLTGYAASFAWLLYGLLSIPDDEIGMDWQLIAIIAVLSLIWPLLLLFELYDAWRR